MTESMGIIERVARAICSRTLIDTGPWAGTPPKVYDDPDRIDMAWVEGQGFVLPVPRWMKYEAQARAAIEAMREPTEAMVSEGDGSIELDSDDLSGSHFYRYYEGDAANSWRAMVDAALKVEP